MCKNMCKYYVFSSVVSNCNSYSRFGKVRFIVNMMGEMSIIGDMDIMVVSSLDAIIWVVSENFSAIMSFLVCAFAKSSAIFDH